MTTEPTIDAAKLAAEARAAEAEIASTLNRFSRLFPFTALRVAIEAREQRTPVSGRNAGVAPIGRLFNVKIEACL